MYKRQRVMGLPVNTFPEFWSTPDAYAFDERMLEIGDDAPPLDAVCGVLGSVSSTSIHCCFRRFQTFCSLIPGIK